MSKQQNIHFLRLNLELHLMRFNPDLYVPKYIKTISDLYRLRFFAREIQFSESSFSHLLGIVFEAFDSGKRFRTLDCLKVLKKILHNKPSDLPLSSEIKEKLFFLYQHYIFHQNKETRWAVNTYLKDETLTDEQILWLMEHCNKSIMILNRLLRYPKYNPIVVSWARDMYKQQKHQNRLSELIALLIDVDIPDFVNFTNSPIVLWAIYYAKIDTETQKTLLKKHFNLNLLDEFIEICMRLGYIDILENVHRQLQSN